MQRSVRCPIAFATLPAETVSDLVSLMSLRTYRKGSHLFYQGEDPHAVWFLETGRAKWFKISEDGQEQILQLVKPGEPVGLVALLDRKPYVAAAMALEDTTAWALSIHDFDRMVMRHPELALLVMRHLGEGVRWLLEHIHCMQNRSAHERVVSVLMRKAQPRENGLRVIPLTHQEIAQLSGMARETASRVLADLQRRGAVRLTRSQVILLDASRFWNGPPEQAQLG
ncbi:MAG: Crp/Fnr family transcriptional regulator [Bacillota bacterium]